MLKIIETMAEVAPLSFYPIELVVIVSTHRSRFTTRRRLKVLSHSAADSIQFLACSATKHRERAEMRSV